MYRLHKQRNKYSATNDSGENPRTASSIAMGQAISMLLSLFLFGCAGFVNASSWNLHAQGWHAPVGSHHAYAKYRTSGRTDAFVGTWKNTNRNTRGLTRVDITHSGSVYRVHAWGRCHPRDCDWGNAVAAVYHTSASASTLSALNVTFHQSTGSITLLLQRKGTRIQAEMMRSFNPRRAAGRHNYLMTENLAKTGGNPQVSTGGTRRHPSHPVAHSGTQASNKPASGVQARFRVIVTGFTVNEQTWDDASNSDGKGDEDFLLTHVAELNTRGGTVVSSDVRSRVMGDTNGWRGRVHAGTAKTLFGGPVGGLATGDQYPTSHPWQLRGKAYDDRAPELVWQGTLKQGDGGVLIAPTIWEWDKAGGDLLLHDWSAVELKLNKLAGSLLNTVSGGATKPFVEGDKALWGLMHSSELAKALGHAATRPIGLHEDSKGHQKFEAKIIRLTYDTAEQIISNNFGKGNGVLEIQYRDSARLHGDYTIYVKVQKI